MAKKNMTDKTIVCEICGEDIEHGDIFHREDGADMCELCYEEKHEYDND